MKLPSYSEFEKYWHHDPETVFLNHGSFGSCPAEILSKQCALQMKMEEEPVRFMTRDWEQLYWENKRALAEFVNCKAEDLVLINNTTMGVNTILHALRLNEHDEILTHNHAYGACLNTLRYYAERYRCRLHIAEVPFPLHHEDEITEAILKAVTPRTRLAMIDHITSATGIVFPVERITRELEARGVEVLVDGAHAPGMLDLNLEAIGASYYTGNCHKWICSPKGSALLHVRKDKQAKISPLQVSHKNDLYSGTNKDWSAQFMWPGTDDYTAFFMIKDSIAFMGQLMGGWEALRERNRKLCLEARTYLSQITGTPLPAPESMISHLSNILVQEHAPSPAISFNMVAPLKAKLLEEYHIQVPVFFFHSGNPRLWVRISVQAYNSPEQYRYLGDCLKELLSN
ncbi:MAG: aminotransferase class V-fold PLP-dependent enzyme [Bacteroidia bacterium]|nr:aminotransferase class V-fold PLP-dependent enzyme [Bacteroidia bacterium]